MFGMWVLLQKISVLIVWEKKFKIKAFFNFVSDSTKRIAKELAAKVKGFCIYIIS